MVFNQLASWLFSTSKADTRALPPRRKCGWNVPSYLFERSFGLGSSVEDVRPADLDVWACARRVVSATLRCDEFLRFPSSLRKTFGIQFHAQKALPLRSKAATARDPLPSQKKKMPARRGGKTTTTIVRARLFYDALRILVFVARRFYP